LMSMCVCVCVCVCVRAREGTAPAGRQRAARPAWCAAVAAGSRSHAAGGIQLQGGTLHSCKHAPCSLAVLIFMQWLTGACPPSWWRPAAAMWHTAMCARTCKHWQLDWRYTLRTTTRGRTHGCNRIRQVVNHPAASTPVWMRWSTQWFKPHM
jgi:hypothetical protein